ncbi:hypothetical protein SAMN05444157_0360 [Frankineae bacterium MT45]|nr:hypothetical protein SAMN05444157_0360 [Frankineae bacterium MT45]
MTATAKRLTRKIGIPTLVAALAVTAYAAAPQAADAVEGPGAVNTTTTPVPPYPGSTRAVDAWKLAGIPTDGKTLGASGSQVAPQWIVTAHHNALPVGDTFTNALGTATIDATYAAPGSSNTAGGYDCSTAAGGPDISISHLATPIAGPAGGFPTLLTDPLPSLDVGLPGYALSAGEGGFTGYIKAAWSDTSGASVTDPSQAITAIGGDSGGASYWYPNWNSAPILANVLVYAGVAFGQSTAQFAGHCGSVADVKAWVDSVFAKYPTQQRPATTTLAAADPIANRAPVRPGALTPLASTASSFSFTLTPSPSYSGWSAPAPTGYRVALVPPAGSGLSPQGTNVTAAALGAGGTVTVTGLTPGVAYTPEAWALAPGGAVSSTLRGSAVTPQPAPGALSSVRAEAYGTYNSSAKTTEFCVHFSYAAPATGALPTTVQISGAGANVTVPWSSNTAEFCHLTAATTFTWSVAPYNGYTPGPVSTLSTTTPAGPTGEPTSVTAAFGTDHCLTLSWTRPATPTAGGTLLSYTVGTTLSDVTSSLAASATSWHTCSLPAGTAVGIFLNANWNRDDVPGTTYVFFTVHTPAA